MNDRDASTSADANVPRRGLGVWLLIVAALIVLAVGRYYVSPEWASELWISPDEVEPAAAAQRLATLGRLDIELAGRTWPIRYPPLFALLLTPAYLVAPGKLGAGIFVALAFAVGAVLASAWIGRAMGGNRAGLFAGLAVLLHPLLARQATTLTTDIPASAAALACCALFVTTAGPTACNRARTLRRYLLAGLMIALAIGLRPMSAVVVLPWLWLIFRRSGDRLLRLGALLAPVAVLVVATALYQYAWFGDFRRTGYQFWAPVPLDYFSLTFSPRYLAANLNVWLEPRGWPVLLLGLAGVIVLWARPRPSDRAALLAAALTALPLSAVHLFFCFSYLRFHDLMLYFACLFAAVATVRVARDRRLVAALATLLVVLVVAVSLTAERGFPPRKRLIADAIRAGTEPDALIISGIDAVYLQAAALKDSRRDLLPAGRWAEYANKLAAWRRIDDPQPPPAHFADHRCPGLLAGGAFDVFPITAMESPEAVIDILRSGRPVYMDLMTSRPEDPGWAGFWSRVEPIPVPQSPYLARLRLR